MSDVKRFNFIEMGMFVKADDYDILERSHKSALSEAEARLTVQEARDMSATRERDSQRQESGARIESANVKGEMARLMKALYDSSPTEPPDRYECAGDYDGGAVMEKHDRGEWVSWSDYLRLLASRGSVPDDPA